MRATIGDAGSSAARTRRQLDHPIALDHRRAMDADEGRRIQPLDQPPDGIPHQMAALAHVEADVVALGLDPVEVADQHSLAAAPALGPELGLEPVRLAPARLGPQVLDDGPQFADPLLGVPGADLGAAGEITPTIAALCALATGPSRLTGIGHLRGHETDRLAAIAR